MLTSIAQFSQIWKHESEATARVLAALTDASLAQRVGLVLIGPRRGEQLI